MTIVIFKLFSLLRDVPSELSEAIATPISVSCVNVTFVNDACQGTQLSITLHERPGTYYYISLQSAS